jgi:hypothetical protein
MDATHDGPLVFLTSPLWSEFSALGATQVTPRSLQFVMSDKIGEGAVANVERAGISQRASDG